MLFRSRVLFLKKDSFSPKSWFLLIEPSCFRVVLDEKERLRSEVDFHIRHISCIFAYI